MRRLIPLLLCFVAATARAQLVTYDGWSLATPLVDEGLATPPMYVVDATSYVAQSSSSPPVCVTPETGVDLTEVSTHFHYAFGTSRFAARPGPDGGLYTIVWGQQLPGQPSPAPALLVVRASCEPGQNVGVYELAQGTPGLPPAFAASWQGPLPTHADGTTYLPTDDGLYALSLTTPGPAVPFVTRADLAALLPDIDPYLRAAAVSQRDEVWLTIDGGSGDESGLWVVSIGRDRGMHVVLRPAETLALGYPGSTPVRASLLDAMLIDGGSRWWIVSEDDPLGTIAVLESSQPARPLVPAGDGGAAFGRHPIVFDPARLDPDRDLLAWSDELARGLLPLDPDSDGDGAADTIEVLAAAGDPLDPNDPAPSNAAPLTLAPSMMLNDWPYMNTESVENGVGASGFVEGRVCNPLHGSIGTPLHDYDCRYPDGTAVFEEPAPTQPWFAADGAHIDEDFATYPIYPLGGDLVFERHPDLRSLVRTDARGSFAVIDLDRECPFLGAEDQRAALCDAYYQHQPDADGVVVLGYVAAHDALVVEVTTRRGGLLFRVDRDHVTPIGHSARFGDRPLEAIGTTPDGALFGRRAAGPPASVVQLDEHLRIVHEEPQPLAARPQHFFRDGFWDVTGYAYYNLPPLTGDTGGCTTVGGITMCAFDAQQAFNLEVTQDVAYSEWVPVSPGLERGEALFWASGRRVPGGTVVTGFAPDWALWRVTRLGGVQRWLGHEAFTALLDVDTRALFLNAPLRAVTTTAAAHDVTRVCFVEAPLNNVARLWEITLDAARVPSSARLVESGDVVACGYDAGALVVMRNEGFDGLPYAVIAKDGAPEIRVRYIDARGFVRLGAHWLILGAVPACVSGSTEEPRLIEFFDMMHATYANGLVYWINREGRSYVSEEAHLCEPEGGRTEALNYFDVGEEPGPFWTRVARGRFATNPWEAKADGATIALRPDGVMLVAPENLNAKHSEVPLPDFYVDRLTRFTPAYMPTSWEHRIPALDPLRRGESRVEPMSIDAIGVRAVSVVPWTEPWPSLGWDHLGGPKPPPRTPPETPDPEVPSPNVPTSPDDEGCGQGPSLAPWLLGAILIGWRASRRRAVVAAVLSLSGCDAEDDPDATYRCHWHAARVCEEYFPYAEGDEIHRVDRAAAESQCTDPTSAHGRGSFGQAECAHGDALGRCVMLPSYLARRYYYVGFQGVSGPDDPLNDVIDSTCGALGPGGSYQRPPFSD